MGRKRSRTGEHFYLSIAAMILISFAGCAALKEMDTKRQGREHLLTAHHLLARRDYSGSLKANQRAFSSHDHIPVADEALFNTGMIYAHYGYPKKDYKKSLDCFKRLVSIFPESRFAAQAAIWIEILQENERTKGEVEESDRTVKEYNLENQRLQLENQRLQREIEELNRTIHKSKQVDIEIDEKRKRLSP